MFLILYKYNVPHFPILRIFTVYPRPPPVLILKTPFPLAHKMSCNTTLREPSKSHSVAQGVQVCCFYQNQPGGYSFSRECMHLCNNVHNSVYAESRTGSSLSADSPKVPGTQMKKFRSKAVFVNLSFITVLEEPF